MKIFNDPIDRTKFKIIFIVALSIFLFIVFPIIAENANYEKDVQFHYWLVNQIILQSHYLPNTDPWYLLGPVSNLYYIYPPGWHFDVAISSVLLNISVIQTMYLVQIVLSLLTILNIYLISRYVFGEKAALYSIVLLCTAPFFVHRASLFSLLPRSLEIYLFTLIMLFCVLWYMKKERKYLVILLFPLIISLFVHYSSVFNIAIPIIFISAYILQNTTSKQRVIGYFGIICSIILIVVPLNTYAGGKYPELIFASLTQIGLITPLVFFGLALLIKSKKIDFIHLPIIIMGSCFFIMCFKNPAPTVFAIIAFTPLAGFCLNEISKKNSLHLLYNAILCLCIISLVFGITFYSTKWTQPLDTDELDNIDQYLQNQNLNGLLLSYDQQYYYHVPSYFVGGYMLFNYPVSFLTQAQLYLNDPRFSMSYDSKIQTIEMGGTNFLQSFPTWILKSSFNDPSFDLTPYKVAAITGPTATLNTFEENRIEKKVYSSDTRSIIITKYENINYPFEEQTYDNSNDGNLQQILDEQSIERNSYLYQRIKKLEDLIRVPQ